MIRMALRSSLGAAVVTALLVSTLHAGAQGHHHARFSYAPVGIVSGESLVLSVARIDGNFPPVPCRIVLLDSLGNVVFDTGTFMLPAVQTQGFAVDYQQLQVNADALGRKQVRAVVLLAAGSAAGFPPNPCRTSVELVDSQTGHTFAIAPPPEADFSN
jgi:hypothetical protein